MPIWLAFGALLLVAAARDVGNLVGYLGTAVIGNMDATLTALLALALFLFALLAAQIADQTMEPEAVVTTQHYPGTRSH